LGHDNHYTVPDDWQPALNAGLGADGKVVVGFRPEAVVISESGDLGSSVYASDLHGGHSMLHLEIAPGEIVHARASREVDYPIGEPRRFGLDPAMARFFNPETELTLSKNGAG
jgi:ABC-type sugar transport system ATPase subunit